MGEYSPLRGAAASTLAPYATSSAADLTRFAGAGASLNFAQCGIQP